MHGTVRGSRLVAALLGTSTVALMSLYCLPLLVGALIEKAAMDVAAAGWIASSELAAMAAAAAGATALVTHVSRLRLAASGALIVCLGQLGSAAVDGYAPLLVLRSATGVGAGLALAACSASLTASHEPDRLFARVMLLRSLVFAAVLPALPLVIDRAGASGAYAALAVGAALLLPSVGLFADSRSVGGAGALAVEMSLGSRTDVPDIVHEASGRAHIGADKESTTAVLVRALPVLGAVGLVATGDGALWSFSERIGIASGLSAPAVGSTLAAATCSGLVGAGLADYLSTSRGRLRPCALALAGIAAAGLALGYARVGWGFAAALVGYSVSFFFLVPYLMGAAAALDPSGRGSVAASSTFLFGAAAGPAIGGIVLATSDGSFAALAWLVVATVAGAVLVVTPSLRALDETGRIATHTTTLATAALSE